MHDYIDLLYMYHNQNLHESVILLGESLLNILYDPNCLLIKTSDNEFETLGFKLKNKILSNINVNYNDITVIYVYFIINSLRSLSYHERVFFFIQKNPIFLKYTEIRNDFFYCTSKIDEKITEKFCIENIKNESVYFGEHNTIHKILDLFLDKRNVNFIKSKSLCLLYEGLASIEVGNKDKLRESFILDYRNLEALFNLKRSKIESKDNIISLIKKYVIDNDLKYLFYFILFYKPVKNFKHKLQNNFNKKDILKDSKECTCKDIINNINDPYIIFSPYKGYRTSKYEFKSTKDSNELLSLGIFMYTNFPKDSYSYICLAYYYMCIFQFREAHRCVTESIKLKPKNNGIEMLFFGYVYSKLKDPGSAINSYKIAGNRLLESYKPILLTALEYKRKNDDLKTESYFQSALECKPESIVILLNYARFLFEIEEFDSYRNLVEKAGAIMKNKYNLQPGENNKRNAGNFKYSNEKFHLWMNMITIFMVFHHFIKKDYEFSEKIIADMVDDWKKTACLGLQAYLKNDKMHAADLFFEVIVQNQDNNDIMKYKYKDNGAKIDCDWVIFDDLASTCLDETIKLGQKEINQLIVEVFLVLTNEISNIKYI